MSQTDQTSGQESGRSASSSPNAADPLAPDAVAAAVERLKRRYEGVLNGRDQGDDGGDDQPGTAGADHDDEGMAEGDHRGEEPTPESAKSEDTGEDETAEPERDRGESGKKRELGEGQRTLKEVAEGLKTSAKSLYEMQVPLNDGSGRYMSVEDLKAGYLNGEAGALDAQRHEFTKAKALHEEARIEQENALLRSKQELQEVLNLVSGVMPPEQLAGYQQQARERQRAEADKLLDQMPQFRDRNIYAAWQRDTVEMLGKYGFSQAEANQIADHRVYKLLDDFKRMRAQIRALENVTGEPPKPPRVVKPQRSVRGNKTAEAVARAKRTGSHADQVTAGRLLLEESARK